MVGRSEPPDFRPDEAKAAVFGRTAVFRLQSPPPRASQTPEEAPLSSRWMRRAGSPPAIVLRLAAKRPASGRSLEGPRPLYHGRSAYHCDNAGPAMHSPMLVMIQVGHARDGPSVGRLVCGAHAAARAC